jgi:hypothetical protein
MFILRWEGYKQDVSYLCRTQFILSGNLFYGQFLHSDYNMTDTVKLTFVDSKTVRQKEQEEAKNWIENYLFELK